MYVLSLILPCYNESSNIYGIISSIKSSIQGRKDVEIILVDNGSTDSTPQVLEQALQGESNKQFKILRIDLLRLKKQKDTYWLDIESEKSHRIRKQY